MKLYESDNEYFIASVPSIQVMENVCLLVLKISMFNRLGVAGAVLQTPS